MKMKKIVCFISLVLLGQTFAAAALPEPILDYDFTAPVIAQRGKYKQQPKFVTAPEITTPVQALKLTKYNYITIPQSADMTIKNGMTFHAVVNFAIDKEIQGKTNTLDMIFFKPGEFLLGRQGKLLYFNVGNGQVNKTKWLMTTLVPGVPAQQWVALTATVGETKPGTYTVNMYINGKKVKTSSYKATVNPANKELVTIGKGWGGWWIMEGLIATTQIYDKVLTPEQVAEIAKQISKVVK
jgi:hypothetical protein